jgi:hypothetical protein
MASSIYYPTPSYYGHNLIEEFQKERYKRQNLDPILFYLRLKTQRLEHITFINSNVVEKLV